MQEKFILSIQTGGQRIDQYLTQEFSYSRNFWNHVIERGGVKVSSHKPPLSPFLGGNRTPSEVKKSYILKAGDTIHIDAVERFLDGGILAECPEIDLDIRLEKEDYLVLYKPKGVLSHPNSIRDVGSPNVVGALYHHFKTLPSLAHFIRAGLLHRLDKETDGLMLIAKTEKGLTHFKDLFQQKSGAVTRAQKEAVPLRKFYRAVCDLSDEGGRFLSSIKAYPHYLESFIHPKVPYPGEAKRGITKILSTSVITSEAWGSITEDFLDCFASSQGPRNTFATLELEILTGRTHQIRYQLSEVGLPIVGDYLYNPQISPNPSLYPQGAPRSRGEQEQMQLTAWKLEFLDCEGAMVVEEL